MISRGTRQPRRGSIVGVIASAADLNAAVKMKKPPDVFEVRLDSLFPITKSLEGKILRVRAPIIITARDPREGGIGNLSAETRRAALQQFLSRADYVDVELRSVRNFTAVLASAKKRKVRRIVSYHNFKSTPSSRSLCAKAKLAKSLGADIFKVATRTDTPAELSRLIGLITSCGGVIPISAMGIGKLGGISRLLLARCGSVLNYASIRQPNVEGQLPIEVLRSEIGSIVSFCKISHPRL